MKTLLIGGTGVISTGIVQALKARGAAITVFNRGQTDDRLGDGVRHLHGDRNDLTAFESAMFREGPWDVVIDMICFTPTQAESDVRAFAGRCGHFIFCSTVCTYGNTETVIPTDESCPQNPHSDYGRGKVACEQIFLRAHATGKMPVTIFRPSHTYGPGGPIINNLGWNASFVDRLRKGLPVIVSGDGHGLWQSTFASDVGAGFAHAAGRERCFGQSYNIVREEVFTWDQYTRRVAAALGAPPPRIVHLPTDWLIAIDPVRLAPLAEIFRYHGVYSSAKLQADVPEFRPGVTLEQGMPPTGAWLDKHNKIVAAETDPWEDRVLERWNQQTAKTPKE